VIRKEQDRKQRDKIEKRKFSNSVIDIRRESDRNRRINVNAIIVRCGATASRRPFCTWSPCRNPSECFACSGPPALPGNPGNRLLDAV